MSLAIVYYPPSAAGNHLKNLINLDPQMQDNARLDVTMYEQQNMIQGTAHARAGRNVQREELEIIIREPDHRWCICGHFGELAPKRDLLLQIPDRQFVIIGIESPTDRWLLETRQARLGQQCHPYWLHEEQPYLYDRNMCKEYWRTMAVHKINLELFWHPDLRRHQIIPQLNQFLACAIPEDIACDLHARWWQANFIQPEILEFYSQPLTKSPGPAIITA